MGIHDMTGLEKRRPVFFNLMQIQMPVGALTSITHRVTGIFLGSVFHSAFIFSIYLCKTRNPTHKSLAYLTSGFSGLQRSFLYGC